MEGQRRAFWELPSWLTTEVDMQTASEPDIQPATGLDHFLHFPNREGEKKPLMCLSRLPSIVQMMCCPVQLNAVHKYSNPIESQ